MSWTRPPPRGQMAAREHVMDRRGGAHAWTCGVAARDTLAWFVDHEGPFSLWKAVS